MGKYVIQLRRAGRFEFDRKPDSDYELTDIHWAVNCGDSIVWQGYESPLLRAANAIACTIRRKLKSP